MPRLTLTRKTLWLLCGAVVLVLGSTIPGRVAYRERLSTDAAAFRHSEPMLPSTPRAHGPRRLVVIVHGMDGGREAMRHVKEAVDQALPGSHILLPEFSASRFSNEDPLVIAHRFLDAIDDAHAKHAYDAIVLVGFSLGAPVARKVLLCAAAGCPEDLLGRRRVWFEKVERVVLLAGMNRGWATHCEKVVALRGSRGGGEQSREETDCRAKHMPWHSWLQAELGQRAAGLLGVGRLIMSMRRGEPFVANLRLDWLDLERSGTPLPPVVQLVGDVDDLVSSNDNVDAFVTRNFTFLRLRQTTHAAAIDMPPGHHRRQQFIRALTTPSDRLNAIDELDRSKLPAVDPSVQQVVFVMHGIRDEGAWAITLGRRFEAHPNVRAFYRSYGYFPALYFLMRHRMTANVRWFVDQYTEVRALYPNATRISFVGHSNGTYMLAHALANYHAVRFHRVVLAGSVVPTTFQWSRYRTRLGSLRSYRGADDFVVAALPSVFEYFPRVLDVGAGGFAGFDDELAREYEDEYFVRGGHGGAIAEQNFPAIVNYVLEQGDCRPRQPCSAYELPADIRSPTQSRLALLFFQFSLGVWAVMVVLVMAIVQLASWITHRVRGRHGTPRTWRQSLWPALIIVGVLLFVLRQI